MLLYVGLGMFVWVFSYMFACSVYVFLSVLILNAFVCFVSFVCGCMFFAYVGLSWFNSEDVAAFVGAGVLQRFPNWIVSLRSFDMEVVALILQSEFVVDPKQGKMLEITFYKKRSLFNLNVRICSIRAKLAAGGAQAEFVSACSCI